MAANDTSPTLSWSRGPGPESRPTIVFVHGFTGGVGTWESFLKLVPQERSLDGFDLACITYKSRFLPDIVGIWSADAPISRLAGELHTCCALGELAGNHPLVLVAHSMGGLVAQRALIEHDDLRQRVTHLFMYGTPSGGLRKASGFAAFLKRQAADMVKGGDFITDLRSRWAAQFQPDSPPETFAVAGANDEFVPSDSVHAGFAPEQQSVVAGNHLEIVHIANTKHPSFQLLVHGLLRRGDGAARDAAALALEHRDFRKVVKELHPIADRIDDEACITLALALESLNRGKEALALLETEQRSSLDAKGVLAGRLKRRWLKERRKADAERAIDLYTSALREAVKTRDHAQAYYHAINCAFLALAYKKDGRAVRRYAQQAQDHCGKSGDKTHWCLATRGEALLYLGDRAGAGAFYGKALATRPKPKPREIGSMYQQARTAAGFLRDEAAVLLLDGIFSGKVDVIDSPS